MSVRDSMSSADAERGVHAASAYELNGSPELSQPHLRAERGRPARSGTSSSRVPWRFQRSHPRDAAAAQRAALRRSSPLAALLTLLLALRMLPVVGPAAEPPRAPTAPTVIIVTGAAGEDEFGKQFAAWSDAWRKAGNLGGARVVSIGATNAASAASATGGLTDRERLQGALAAEAKQTEGDLWLVLLGHGTFDGKEAKFNLVGPDLAASDLADWLKPMRRPLAIVDTSSASGAFIKKLSAPGRVIVTATRSGSEENYARFGDYLAAAIIDPLADLDRDGQISLLEAFIAASHKVVEFYRSEGRLATEHALLDDNGDGLGTPPDWFRGTRAVKRATEGGAPDGLLAAQLCLVPSDFEKRLTPAQRQRRGELETALARLRDLKSKLTETEYYQQLEPVLLELARLYQSVK